MRLNMRVVLVERDERKAKTSGRVRSPFSTPKLRALEQAWNFGGKRTPSFEKTCDTQKLQSEKKELGQVAEQVMLAETAQARHMS